MGNLKDLTGQTFGRLTVIKRAGSNKKGLATWVCLCECGKEVIVVGSYLRDGSTKSCGCLKKEQDTKNLGQSKKGYNINDLTGKKFGKLTVIRRDNTDNLARIQWLCKCDCENPNLVSVRASNLTSGNTKSCGCLIGQNLKDLAYDLTNQKFGALTALYPVYLDNEKKGWHCKCECGNEKDYSTSSLTQGDATSCGCHIYRNQQQRVNLTGKKFGRLLVLENIYKENEKTICKCLCDCGNIVEVKATNLQRGNTLSCGCLRSKGELKIRQLLDKLNINYIQQKKFEDLKGESTYLKFDFYLPAYNILIEYQGEQHYNSETRFKPFNDAFEIRQKYDNLKRDYCKNNNIKLIEIPYWDFDKLDEKYLIERIKEENVNDKH